MPLQNRINPEGEICYSPARGSLMGNRGCLHNSSGQIVSRSKRDAWITCLLEFKGTKLVLMRPGEYTQLFFLDEATALAAGHRHCATCRRERFNAFFTAWSTGNRNGAKVLAREVDKQMKADRAASARVETASLARLPDGVIVKQTCSDTCYLVRNDKLHPWSFAGYGTAQMMSAIARPFILLTPASTIKTMRQGYKAQIHTSAA